MINNSITSGDNAPLVAVLSTVKLSSSNGFPSGKEARVFEEQFTIAKQYGIIMFLFFANDIDWINKSIKGYTFIPNEEKQGQWVTRIFPFPDVVYNRVRYRKIENQPKVKQILTKFNNDPHIQLFNTRFLDKWEVYQALANDPLTSKMIPPTRLLSFENLKRFLDSYSQVFIKPRNNNAGRGIIKVIRRAPHGYSYCLSESSSLKWKKCLSFSNLRDHLSEIIQKPDEYLIQTGIDLCKLEGRVFDLRAQVQKDGAGQWIFTGVNVRVAARNRFVTYDKYSVPKRISFAKVIQIVCEGAETFKGKINSQLLDLYHWVPRVLEKDLGLSLAVLSIDIGIDVNGRVWIIEVSSKSDSFDENSIRARHFQYLMEYLLYITGRSNPRKNTND